MTRLRMMWRTVEELREKTWELDTSTRCRLEEEPPLPGRNNLVFYGLKEDMLGANNAEWMVKEVMTPSLGFKQG
jgi:hypothetical protein